MCGRVRKVFFLREECKMCWKIKIVFCSFSSLVKTKFSLGRRKKKHYMKKCLKIIVFNKNKWFKIFWKINFVIFCIIISIWNYIFFIRLVPELWRLGAKTPPNGAPPTALTPPGEAVFTATINRGTQLIIILYNIIYINICIFVVVV